MQNGLPENNTAKVDALPDAASQMLSSCQGIFQPQPGLILISSDFVPDTPFELEGTTFPCVCLSIVIEGRAEGSTGTIDTGFTENEVWLASTNDSFRTRKRILPGAPVRTVELVVTPEWFAKNELRFNGDPSFERMRASLERPTRVHRRALDPRLRQIAWSIQRPPANAVQASLHLEGRALDLLAAMTVAYTEEDSDGSVADLGAQALDRMMAVRRRIDAEPIGSMTVALLAAEFGMSVSKLRQDFFAAFGTCTGNYINMRRLEMGRELIERQGLSISEAAYRSGYSHPGNFTAAFKRRFGYPPSAMRA